MRSLCLCFAHADRFSSRHPTDHSPPRRQVADRLTRRRAEHLVLRAATLLQDVLLRDELLSPNGWVAAADEVRRERRLEDEKED